MGSDSQRSHVLPSPVGDRCVDTLLLQQPPNPSFLESRPPVSGVTLSPQSQSSSYAHLSASSPGSELPSPRWSCS